MSLTVPTATSRRVDPSGPTANVDVDEIREHILTGLSRSGFYLDELIGPIRRMRKESNENYQAHIDVLSSIATSHDYEDQVRKDALIILNSLSQQAGEIIDKGTQNSLTDAIKTIISDPRCNVEMKSYAIDFATKVHPNTILDFKNNPSAKSVLDAMENLLRDSHTPRDIQKLIIKGLRIVQDESADVHELTCHGTLVRLSQGNLVSPEVKQIIQRALTGDWNTDVFGLSSYQPH